MQDKNTFSLYAHIILIIIENNKAYNVSVTLLEMSTIAFVYTKFEFHTIEKSCVKFNILATYV